MAYRPNAGRAVRSAYAGVASSTVYPVAGETVFCVVLGERDLGDDRRAWVDSYVANVKGNAPQSFLRRV